MSDQDRDIMAIVLEMVGADLPADFVIRVHELARQSEGVEDLVHLWAEAVDEREEIEAALYEAIEDRTPDGPVSPVESMSDADRILEERKALKNHLRELVENHGGVTAVARRAGMPQPSLSRLLNSMSEPRPSTLLRLAEAMNVSIDTLTNITAPAERRTTANIPRYRLTLLGSFGIRYGVGLKLQEAR